MDTLHEDVCTFMTKTRSVLGMRSVSYQVARKIKTHFMFNKFSHNCEIMWNSMVQT